MVYIMMTLELVCENIFSSSWECKKRHPPLWAVLTDQHWVLINFWWWWAWLESRGWIYETQGRARCCSNAALMLLTPQWRKATLMLLNPATNFKCAASIHSVRNAQFRNALDQNTPLYSRCCYSYAPQHFCPLKCNRLNALQRTVVKHTAVPQ